MTNGGLSALAVERSCSLVAAALSGGNRKGARLMSGDHRVFGMNVSRTIVNVPFPIPQSDWTLRTLSAGVALQCAPSKDLIAQRAIHELTGRELRALGIVEGRVAFGWLVINWPGMVPELQRRCPDLEPIVEDLDGTAMLDQALALADSGAPLPWWPLLGKLPCTAADRRGMADTARRMWGRMPWTSRRQDAYRIYSVPVGGEGGVKNPNLPPPSRPEDEEIEISPDQRPGVPYPEWNFWSEKFLPDHVAVLERKYSLPSPTPTRPAADVRRFFEVRTKRVMRSGLEDGCDLDIDRYVDYFVDCATGHAAEGRLFRDLMPTHRDVTTCLLLDGSSSVGAHRGHIFRLELQCADSLSQAMSQAKERHGIFVFTGNTRHRVDIRCLKDFDDRGFVAPTAQGLVTAGYTRLGAPLRHLTARLLDEPSQRRLLVVVGDGLISDEGYEGRYAWADVSHAVEEAEDAGVFVYYIAVGPTRVDPLPEVFGSRRSQRIRRIEELPSVLGHVHRELVAA